MIPVEMAEALAREAVGLIRLIELDTTDGLIRLAADRDGWFTDANGVRWAGSRLVSMSRMQSALNGTAPGFEIRLAYLSDPDRTDLIDIIRAHGVAAIRRRPARIYLQYFSDSQYERPVAVPVLIATRTMHTLTYGAEADRVRTVTVGMEGPHPLRSRPVAGRYTDADQKRRFPGDRGLEEMPTDDFDAVPLFGQ